MHTRRCLSRLGRRCALSRPVYNVATTNVASLHHDVAIEYTEIYIYSLQEVGILTHFLQGFGSDAIAVVEELRILIPVLSWRRGLLKNT